MLRSEIVFRRADSARANGFTIELDFVATEDVELNIERVSMRAQSGGHAAPKRRLRESYEMSLWNFTRAVRELDRVDAFDNTRLASRPNTFWLRSTDELLMLPTTGLPG